MNAAATTARAARIAAWMDNPDNAYKLLIVQSAYDHSWVVTGRNVWPHKSSTWDEAMRYALRKQGYRFGLKAVAA